MLQIGDFILKNTSLNMRNWGENGLKVDGLINNKLLEHFRVNIDFIKIQIKFEIKEKQ